MAEAQVLLLSEEEKKKDAYLSLESITYARPIHYEKINDIFNKYNVVITNKDERTLSQYLEKERTDYNDKNLRDEICKAYNENDQDLDLIIYKILFDEFDLGLRKRQKIYDILLHEYFKVIDLKIDNIINVSCTLIKQLKFEDIIDINKFMVIAKKENLNGDKIMGLKNARLFTNLFKSMNVTNSKLAKIFVHFKKKWKAKNYSKMEENEEKKKEERKEQKKEEKKEEEDEEEKDDKKQEESDDINPNQLMEDDKIPHCRDNEVHNIKDPLPKYLYKSIFYRSEDETVEALVDYAMLKVLGCNKWRKPNFVKKLYKDTTYFEAVIELYEELNENEFFDKFVKKHAKRELEIWKIKMEETKHIHSKEQIWNILQSTDFKDLDEDQSNGIDQNEFLKYFKEHRFYIDQKILMDIFNQIDFNSNGEISMKEYNRWKQGLPKPIKGKLSQIDEKEDGDTDVYWNNNKKRYEIRIQNDNNNDDDEDDEETKDTEKITITNIEWEKEYGDGWKWAVYAPKLKNKKERLKYKRLGVEVNGYWDVLPRERKPACIKYEELSEEHLNIIFQLLHYYYLTQIDVSLQNSNRYKRDNSVLKQIYFAEKDKLNEDEVEELRKFTEREVIICIEENEYELIWWNGKGKHEANAITIINHTAHKQRTNAFHSKHDNNNKSEPEPKEISYLRFDSNVKGLEWKWYDNDSSSFRPMGEYKNDDDETECYMPLIWQLDCTFLANVKHNFVPSTFDEQFDNAWLPKLSYFTKNILNLPGGCDDFIFDATFNTNKRNPKLNEIIVNMEQKGFKWSTRSFFTRNLKRMVDGRDSLLTYFRDSDLFIERWKQSYHLYTPSQQHFFFLCILSVATTIKYIDIEFSNQCVLIPLRDTSDDYEKDNILMELIDDREVTKDAVALRRYKGCICPPTDEWRSVDDDEHRVSKSDILIKAQRHIEYEEKTIERQPRWIQRLTDKTKEQIQCGVDSPHLFTEDEATFLRFAECIRKYVLEYELGDTLDVLWPWYRNSFHCGNSDKYHDADIYNSLMVKYNLAQKFAINDMRKLLRKKWKIGDKCNVYLDDNKWYAAKIKKIENTEYGESLYIEYKGKSSSKTKTMAIKRISERISGVDDGNDNPSIRHKRKFAAMQLLNRPDIERNLNIIKHELDLCLDDIIDDIFEVKFKSATKDKIKGEEDISFKIIYKKDWKDDEDQMLEDTHKYKCDWKAQIEKVNKKFEKLFDNKLNKSLKYKLFNQNLENVESIDITKFTLPLFEQFVFEFFVDSDKEIYDKHSTKNPFIGVKEYCYRMWIEDWRDTPDWYCYRHDILLLELVMRNGINTDDINNDLNGEKEIEYKLRLKKGDENSTIFHGNSYYRFKTWCKQRINILHRLKYVTNIIVMNLQKDEYKPSLIDIRIPEQNKKDRPTFNGNSLLFSDYQSKTHQDFAERGPLLKLVDSTKHVVGDVVGVKSTKKKVGPPKLDRMISSPQMLRPSTRMITSPQRTGLNEKDRKDHMEDMEDMDIDKDKSNEDTKEEGKIYHVCDPFLSRNIDDEMFDCLQSFDLINYGQPLALFIIGQLKQEDKDSYYKILCALFNYLPYHIAAETIGSEKDFLQHIKPDKLRELCMNVVKGTLFEASAALGVAEFFDELSEQDIVQEEIWKEISSEFEKMACEQLNKIESDHLLFLLLNVPVASHKGKSLVNLALEQRRLAFLNSDRIANVMQHMYRQGFLKPTQDPKTKPLKWSELFQTSICQPFNFYFTAQGYHWIAGILFMLYLAFVCTYANLRPLSGDVSDKQTIIFELILWTCNLGYILYEGFEWKDKGKDYLNLGVKGQTNLMDVVICLIWMTLGALRITLVVKDITFEEGETGSLLQNAYIFLFGIQITVLTLRSLTLFSNTQYLGTLLRIIKLMFIEIYKFMFIFVVVMVGFLFGLWFIVLTNDEQSDDFEVNGQWNGLKYVFQVFIGTGDLGGVGDQTIAILFMIGATILGTLILTNLLIALMTTEYEKVSERAKQEVIFNQIELTYDLSNRSRLLPPPLNVIVIVISCIIWLINVVTSVCFKWNIYAYLHYESFLHLRQTKYLYGYPLFVTTILWIVLFVGVYIENIPTIIGSFGVLVLFWIIAYFIGIKQNDETKLEPTKYWKSITGRQALKWYCRYFYCKREKKRDEFDDTPKTKNDVDIKKIHHRECYHELVLHLKDANQSLNPVKGITIAKYIDEYEKENNEINHVDKSIVKQVTTNTLFCEKCYRPFEYRPSKEKEIGIDEKHLSMPFASLLDFASAITFVFIPIGWLPLVLLIGLLALKDKIVECFGDDDTDSEYTNQMYDAEYFERPTTRNST